jgi:hypothetical protein
LFALEVVVELASLFALEVEEVLEYFLGLEGEVGWKLLLFAQAGAEAEVLFPNLEAMGLVEDQLPTLVSLQQSSQEVVGLH